MRSARRKQYAREYGSSDHSLARHQRLVQSQFFANIHQARVDRGSQINYEFPANAFSLSISIAILILPCDCDFFEFSCNDALVGAHEDPPWFKSRQRLPSLPGASVMRLTTLVAGLNAGIVPLMPLLGLLRAAARVWVLQYRNTSEVFRADRPSQESSSSGRRPMMCPSS